MLRPVDDLSPRHPARTQHRIGPGIDALQQSGQLLGLVRAVGIHLDDDVVAVIQTPGEAVQICRTEALLAGSVRHLQL